MTASQDAVVEVVKNGQNFTLFWRYNQWDVMMERFWGVREKRFCGFFDWVIFLIQYLKLSHNFNSFKDVSENVAIIEKQNKTKQSSHSVTITSFHCSKMVLWIGKTTYGLGRQLSSVQLHWQIHWLQYDRTVK